MRRGTNLASVRKAERADIAFYRAVGVMPRASGVRAGVLFSMPDCVLAPVGEAQWIFPFKLTGSLAIALIAMAFGSHSQSEKIVIFSQQSSLSNYFRKEENL